MYNPHDRVQFLNLGALVEGGLILLAFFLAWVFHVDWLSLLHWNLKGVVWSFAGLVPLLILFFVMHRFPIGSMLMIKRFLIDVMGPSLSACKWYDLIILAGLAGFSEELLFRGVLQPGFEQLWSGTTGYIIGIIIVSVLFGVVHAVTLTYAILAAFMGAYLSWLLDFSGERNLVIPMLVHAMYDFVAFLVIRKSYRTEQHSEQNS